MTKSILKITAIFLFGLCFSQTIISKEEAIEKALKNNLGIKTSALKITLQEKLKNSGTLIEPTIFSGEFGQINSYYTDNRFSINQNLRWPQYYSAQKKVLFEEYKNAILNYGLQQWQLKKEINLLFNELNYLGEKKKILQKKDSILTQYFLKAELRLRKGESNLLEKATAENQRSQSEIHLIALEQEQKIALQKLNFLIHDGQKYQNKMYPLKRMELEPGSEFYSGNPLLLEQLEQEKKIQEAKLKAEKTKLLPSFNFGYSNMSMYGTGADNLFYQRSSRFQSATIGLGIPIFNSAQKSIIEAQKIHVELAQLQYQNNSQEQKNAYLQNYYQFEKLEKEVNYFESKGIKNSLDIIQLGHQQFYNGEINYLEWTLLMQQAFDIQTQYINLLKDFNDKVIELNALRTK